MKKIVVGPKAKGAIDLNKTAEENIISVSKALGKDDANDNSCSR